MSGRIYAYDEVARDANGIFVPLATPGAIAGDDPGIALPQPPHTGTSPAKDPITPRRPLGSREETAVDEGGCHVM